jgi:hypothetical protein
LPPLSPWGRGQGEGATSRAGSCRSRVRRPGACRPRP